MTPAKPDATPTPCGCPEERSSLLTRRHLLRLSAAAGMITATTSSQARVAFAAAPPDGAPADTLVVISLRGGFDGLSAIVPVGDPAYAAARPTIGVPASTLHRVDDMFGLHPAMAPLFPLWRAGTLGAVHAVGQSAPTRSHFEAMEQMERAAPGSSLRTGWIDRTVGLLPADRPEGGAFTATQLNSPTVPASLRGPHPKFAARALRDVTLMLDERIVGLSAWERAVGAIHHGAADPVSGPVLAGLAAVRTLRDLPGAPVNRPPGAPRPGGEGQGDAAAQAGYPPGTLGTALHDVARLVRSDLGLRFATVDVGDWDMHQGLGTVDKGWFTTKLTQLSLALAAFARDLGPDLGGVTVVTLSEFGRRVAENGSGGVDHGHGNAVLVMGGGVRGGRVYGRWPGLAPDALDDGDLAVTTDYRHLMAEILTRRCGVRSVGPVFPGLRPVPVGILTPRT